MRAVLQRTDGVSLEIGNQVYSQTKHKGLLVFCGFETSDTQEDIDWMVRKILNMRIFPDDEGKMNKSLVDVGGELMVVSQFTLHASTKKGNRPSFINAAKPALAEPLYEAMIRTFQSDYESQRVKTGEFGADMNITFNNNGPVTIIMDSKQKE